MDEVVAWSRRFRSTRLQILPHRVDTPWTRDWGPIQTRRKDGGITWVRPTYAAHRTLDVALAKKLAPDRGVAYEDADFLFDGGAIVGDGQGLCVVTEGTLKGRRFDGVVWERRRQRLMTALGCDWLLVVPGLPREPTHHADLVLQFLAPDTVVVSGPPPASKLAAAMASASNVETGADALAAGFDATRAGLLAAYRRAGRPAPRIVSVPAGRGRGQHSVHERGKLYYSYVNLVRTRDSLLAPHYASAPRPLQAAAYAALESALPDGIELTPIPADRILQGAGGLHCIVLPLVDATPR